MKTFLIATNGEIEFKMTTHAGGVALNYEGAEWTDKCRGTTAGSVCSDGNGYVVTVGENKFRLDYCEAQYLYLLLAELHRGDVYTRYKKVKS